VLEMLAVPEAEQVDLQRRHAERVHQEHDKGVQEVSRMCIGVAVDRQVGTEPPCAVVEGQAWEGPEDGDAAAWEGNEQDDDGMALQPI